MADLFWAYWEASVRFALLALVLIVASPLLKRWLSARLICAAWALLLLRLVLPASVPMTTDLFKIHDGLQPSAWTESIRQSVVNVGWGETILPAFPDAKVRAPKLEVGVSWEMIFVSVWLLGILGGSGHFFLNVRRLRRFFSRAELQKSGHLYELFCDVRNRYGVHENVPLLVSRDVVTPGIAGIFNPRIILPQRCVDGLDDEELRCVFVHELTHFKRGDLFVHHVLLLICYLHWFNPLAWLVLRSFKISMEQACDAAVIDTACISTARQYGLTILRVVQQAGSASLGNAGVLCLLGNRKSSALKDRIRLIARPKSKSVILTVLGLASFSTAFAFVVTGDADPQTEAMRLMRLTRVASPFSGGYEKVEEKIAKGPAGLAALLSEYPRSWVTNMEISDYESREVSLDAALRIEGEIATTQLWVWISADDGEILEFRKLDSVSLVANGRRQSVHVHLDIPERAKELCYGLFFSGSGQAWLEDLQLNEE